MSILRNLALIVFLVASVLPTRFAVAGEGLKKGPATRFSVRFFNKLTPLKRMQFAVAAMVMRGSDLSNITFNMHDRVENFGRNLKQGTWMYATNFAMRRKGISFWIHLRQYYTPDHHSFINFFTSWDGSVQRSVSYQAGIPSPDCIIMDKPYTAIRPNVYLDILGFRVDTSLYDTTLATYLRNAINNKWQQYSARARTSSDGPEIVVRVSTGSNVGASYRYLHYREYWLDAERGFMPVRYHEVYWSQGKVDSRVTAEVTSAKRINGVWVPLAMKQTAQNSAMPGVRTVRSCQIKQFSIGTVKSDDLRLEFPKGSRLLNLITMRSYYKNHLGKLVPQPLYIPQSGEILRPISSAEGTSKP
ncbi:MAG: hypothetical protein ACP5I8_16325 [Phycisphaerae bacterium]